MLKVTLKFKDTLATYVIQNRAIIEKSPVLLVEIENLVIGDLGRQLKHRFHGKEKPWFLVLEKKNAFGSPINAKNISPETYPAHNTLPVKDLTPMLLVAEFYGFKDFSDAVAGIIAEKFQNLASEVVRFELRFWIIYSMNPMS